MNDSNSPPTVADADATRPQVGLVFGSAIRRVPELSVAAVLLTAIFNVGFFAEVGLHFIGTMDFTNFVYSFALVFSILFAFFQSTFSFAHDFLRLSADPQKAWLKLRVWYLVALGVIVAVYGGAMFAPTRYVPNLLLITNPLGQTTFWWLLAIMQIVAGYLWVKLGIFTLADVGYVAFPIIAAVAALGKSVAYNQIFSTQRYTVVTHSSTINHAALVRTSPAGFLIAFDGTMAYYPTSEIRSVTAEVPIKP